MRGPRSADVLWYELGVSPENHVFPAGPRPDDPERIATDHNLEGRSCWCEPKVEQVCPICTPETFGDCPHCDDQGWTSEFTDDPEWSTLVVHQHVSRAEVN